MPKKHRNRARGVDVSLGLVDERPFHDCDLNKLDSRVPFPAKRPRALDQAYRDLDAQHQNHVHAAQQWRLWHHRLRLHADTRDAMALPRGSAAQTRALERIALFARELERQATNSGIVLPTAPPAGRPPRDSKGSDDDSDSDGDSDARNDDDDDVDDADADLKLPPKRSAATVATATAAAEETPERVPRRLRKRLARDEARAIAELKRREYPRADPADDEQHHHRAFALQKAAVYEHNYGGAPLPLRPAPKPQPFQRPDDVYYAATATLVNRQRPGTSLWQAIESGGGVSGATSHVVVAGDRKYAPRAASILFGPHAAPSATVPAPDRVTFAYGRDPTATAASARKAPPSSTSNVHGRARADVELPPGLERVQAARMHERARKQAQWRAFRRDHPAMIARAGGSGEDALRTGQHTITDARRTWSTGNVPALSHPVRYHALRVEHGGVPYQYGNWTDVSAATGHWVADPLPTLSAHHALSELDSSEPRGAYLHRSSTHHVSADAWRAQRPWTNRSVLPTARSAMRAHLRGLALTLDSVGATAAVLRRDHTAPYKVGRPRMRRMRGRSPAPQQRRHYHRGTDRVAQRLRRNALHAGGGGAKPTPAGATAADREQRLVAAAVAASLHVGFKRVTPTLEVRKVRQRDRTQQRRQARDRKHVVAGEGDGEGDGHDDGGGGDGDLPHAMITDIKTGLSTRQNSADSTN